jgi:hypothetical protein
MRRYGPLRLFRSALITGAVFSLAAGGHVLGGGTLPPVEILIALTALLLMPVTWMAGRQLSLLALLGILGAGQLLLHEAFTALSHPAVCLPHASTVHAGHVGAAAASGTTGIHCLPLEALAPAQHAAGGLESLTMLAGHLLATAATAWIILKGEASLVLLLAWLRPARPVPAPPAVLPAGPRRFTRGSVTIPAPWRNLRTDSLRGPPAVVLP